MRVAYALGVLDILQASPLARRLRAIYTSSAGLIAALGLVGASVDSYAEDLLPRLAGRRFINPRRVFKVVDVDYLVDDVVLPLVDRACIDDSGSPLLIVSAVDERSGIVGHMQATSENVGDLLRATMAIPVLYGRSVQLGGRAYIDGGVGDPVPIAEALSKGHGEPVAVVLTKSLDDVTRGVRGKERLAVWLDPRIRSPVRHLLLSRSLLGAQAEAWLRSDHFGDAPLIVAAPSDRNRIISRTCTDVAMLRAFLDLGRSDGRAFCDAIDGALKQGSRSGRD